MVRIHRAYSISVSLQLYGIIVDESSAVFQMVALIVDNDDFFLIYGHKVNVAVKQLIFDSGTVRELAIDMRICAPADILRIDDQLMKLTQIVCGRLDAFVFK